MPAKPRAAVALLLAASLLLGLAHIALLPPWEGFDETGHYSYIQQVATTGHWTRRGDKMSKDIDHYLKVAPANENVPRQWTYHQFFSADPEIIARGREIVHALPAAPRSFVPGVIGNWQAQHPPLYYYLMAPAFLVSSGWSLGAQLFFLRAISYLIAWASLAILAIVMLRRVSDDERMTVLLPLALGLCPLMFPIWFPEMARIGNDSAVTLLATCTFVLVERAVRRATTADYALLGGTLGVALMTKATFLPVTAAVVAVLAGLAWRARAAPAERARRLTGLGLCLMLVACISAWWYVGNLLETGSLIGSNDAANMSAPAGMLAELRNVLSRYRLMLTLWVSATSFLWYGTWSFVQPPPLSMVPLLGLVAILLFGSWRYLRERGLHSIGCFALLTFFFFSLALLYQSLILLISTANPAATWYLHSVSPIWAVLVGCGIAGAARFFWLRQLIRILLAYALVFFPAATLLNLLFFAGCAPFAPTGHYISFDNALRCVSDFSRVYDNLAVLTMPNIGFPLLVIGWIVMLAGAFSAMQFLGTFSNDEMPVALQVS
jgi:hypothetical protein